MKGKNLLKYALHAAAILGAVWAAIRYIDGEQFTKALHDFDWKWAPVVGLLGIAAVVVKAWRFASLLKKTVEVDRFVAMKAYVAGQSMTLLPGGIAGRSALLKQIGIEVGESGSAVALSSITDQIGFILCAMVSALWFEAARKPALILLAVLAVVSICLGIEAVRSWLGRAVEWILGKFNAAHQWQDFVKGMRKTATPKMLIMGVLNALMAFAMLVFALHLCMYGTGASLPPMVLLLAFSLPTMLGRISALPGGFGVTEVGIVTILDQAPSVRLDQAAAAVLVFRLGTVVLTAAVGAIVYLVAWRKEDKGVKECPAVQS